MAEFQEDKYIVIPTKYVDKMPVQVRHRLLDIQNEIRELRKFEGKSDWPKYLVGKQSEPYAEEVKDLILLHAPPEGYRSLVLEERIKADDLVKRRNKPVDTALALGIVGMRYKIYDEPWSMFRKIEQDCWNCKHIDRDVEGTTPFCYVDGCCATDVSTVKGGCDKFELYVEKSKEGCPIGKRY